MSEPTHPTNFRTAPTTSPRSSTRGRAGVATVVASTLAAISALAGCASRKSLPQVPVASKLPTASPAAPHAPDPADLMFQSAGEPFARPASDVNVFGELDGIGPNPFDASGATGFRQVTLVEDGYDADETLSPDGKWLLFSSTRHSERPDIYLQRVGGQAVTQLTADPADDSFPRFSPDGTQIVFASNRAGTWNLYAMDVEGKNVRQLTRGTAQDIHPSFSPDGTRIVYSSLGSRSGQWELWTLNLQTGERRMIGYGLFPDWSPRTDKDVIAFQRARQRGTRWFSVWTMNLADGEACDLTEIAYSPTAAIVAPNWSPDGKRIAFGSIADPQAAQDAHTHNAQRSATQDIWTAAADGSDRRRLTDGRGTNAAPAWGSDGRIYFVSDRGGNESIWSTPAGSPLGDSHARRPRLPDDLGGSAPTEAEPAARHVEVPPATPVLPPNAGEPARAPLSPFVAVRPSSPEEESTPRETTPQPHAAAPSRIVDAPIVLQPIEPAGAKHEGPADDSDVESAGGANAPASTQDESAHSAETEHPTTAAPSSATDEAHAGH